MGTRSTGQREHFDPKSVTDWASETVLSARKLIQKVKAANTDVIAQRDRWHVTGYNEFLRGGFTLVSRSERMIDKSRYCSIPVLFPSSSKIRPLMNCGRISITFHMSLPKYRPVRRFRTIPTRCGQRLRHRIRVLAHPIGKASVSFGTICRWMR